MPSVVLNLSPRLERIIDEQIASGRFASASDVVGEALTMLDRETQEKVRKLEALRREVDVGLRQLDNGQYSTRSSDEIADAALRDAGE